jgi:hypothetical protein
MVKTLFFFLFIITVVFYPLVVDENQEMPKKNLKASNLPDVEFFDGKFYIYQGVLTKKGHFSVLKVYKKGYIAFKLDVDDLVKAENYKADRTVFKDNTVTGYNVIYKNADMELKTDVAHYYKDTKRLTGGKFQVFSKDFKGYGKNFRLNDKKDLYARNITYYLKVNK